MAGQGKINSYQNEYKNCGFPQEIHRYDVRINILELLAKIKKNRLNDDFFASLTCE